jgi:molecular chaperone DnaK (HSP70)
MGRILPIKSYEQPSNLPRQTSFDSIDCDPITRGQFESLIAVDVRRIEDCLLETLARSGLSRQEIDAVVRTGGSVQIPYVIDMLGHIFGPEKFVLSDVFGSVSSGLAIRAHAGEA